MAVTVLGSWLVASSSQARRSYGFWVFLVSNALWWFDAKVIDGAVNGAGWLAQRYGALLRRSQTGHVQNYALGMAAGLVVVLVAFLVFRS